MTDLGLAGRVERIESQLAIGQLPIRYAMAVDARDIDAWVNCFRPDVNINPLQQPCLRLRGSRRHKAFLRLHIWIPKRF